MRFALNEYNDIALHVGSWARAVRDAESAVGLDAVVILAALEYKGLQFGFSYDSHVKDFAVPGPKRAAFEVSVTFIGEYEDDDPIACPTF